MIFDAHVHIFRTLRGRIASGPVTALPNGRIWVGDHEIQMLPATAETTTFPVAALLAQMDSVGVDRAMMLQGPFYGDQNAEVLEAAAEYPTRLKGAAYFDPWAAAPHQSFAAIVQAKGFCALKLECAVATGLCGVHPEARLDAPDLAWLWAELESSGLVLVVDLGAVGSRSYQTAAMRAIAEAHPNLKIVVAHLGQIRPAVVADPERLRQWQQQIDLGLLQNVWFDWASLPAYCAEDNHPYSSLADVLRRAVDRIGAKKILWGSDVPGPLGHTTYRQLVALGTLHCGFLSDDDRARIMGQNALAVYG
jgi:predicted TIM-barrel fold metal-dependent hydrolase